MRHLATLILSLALWNSVMANPFSNTYGGTTFTATLNLPTQQPTSRALPNYTYVSPDPPVQTAPAPQYPQFAPAPLPVQAPVAPATVTTSVSSTSLFPSTPAPAPTPIYAAPAPSPIPPTLPPNMTLQQIIQFLLGPLGRSLPNQLTNGAANIGTQCKTLCDALPSSPVCDGSNIRYRNSCEANCIQRSTSTNNLRYGMCCCSDDDYDYDNGFFIHATAGVTETNMCLSTCIYNCLGGDSPIESEHTTPSQLNLVKNSAAACNAVTA